MTKKIWLLPLLFTLLAMACSDPQDAPTLAPESAGVHPAGFASPASQDFHGDALAQSNYDLSQCRQCHGNQFDGGIAKVSCKTCHPSYPHPQGFAAPGANSHISFVKNSGYDLNSCKTCHGQDYGTTKVNNSCLTCHTQTNGPEACNTCHGDFSADATDLKNVAPPKGLDDETDPASPAVGAHQAHLSANPSFTAARACRQCHNVPQNAFSPDHLDGDGVVELPFADSLATFPTEGGARTTAVSYDRNNNTCSGSYCHGNWGLLKSMADPSRTFGYAATATKMEGNNAAPVWNDSTSAACGTCHGLPPTGHAPLTTCSSCHTGVVNAANEIIDKTKHVNGKANLFGQEYPMY